MGLRGWLTAQWWQRSLPLAAWALTPLSGLYRVVWALRAAAYAAGLLRTQATPVPVLVVGNLIVGGAGKTPTTLALIEGLKVRGWHPGVVSRGYGGRQEQPASVSRQSSATDCGDEPLLLHLRTGVPVWTGRQRAAAAQALCAANPAVNIVLADDGLQHLALARDAQVIVFDARGQGNGWCLPAGPLREPFQALPPARSVVLYNAGTPSTAWPGHLAQRRLGRFQALPAWWRNSADTLSVPELMKRPLIAAAGIAEPERFFAMLEDHGLRFTRLPLDDHAALDPAPWPAGDATVIVTEKDAVKLRPDSADAARIVVATLDFQLPAAFWDALLALLPMAPEVPQVPQVPQVPLPPASRQPG